MSLEAFQDMSAKATVGEILAVFLERCGVRVTFGVISIHNMPFLDAIGIRNNIRFVASRSEAGAVNMADAYARVAPQLGVAFTSLGDGRISLGKEGGPSKRRVLHVKDMTGKAIEEDKA